MKPLTLKVAEQAAQALHRVSEFPYKGRSKIPGSGHVRPGGRGREMGMKPLTLKVVEQALRCVSEFLIGA